MGYIGAHGVAALHRYKYSGVDHSYLAKYVLQPLWTCCVHFIYLMDIHIWYTLLSAIYGAVMGARAHLGKIRSIEMAHKHFESFPKAIVNNLVSPQIKRMPFDGHSSQVLGLMMESSTKIDENTHNEHLPLAYDTAMEALSSLITSLKREINKQ